MNSNLGSLEVTRYLIEMGANIESTDMHGHSALHISSRQGNWKYWYLMKYTQTKH